MQGTAPQRQLRLSEKEMMIISGVTQGLKNKDIAREVGTTEQVVKNYLRKIYDKLDVADRLELAREHASSVAGRLRVPGLRRPTTSSKRQAGGSSGAAGRTGSGIC